MSKIARILPLTSLWIKNKKLREFALLEVIIVIPAITSISAYCLALSNIANWLSRGIPVILGVFLIQIYVKYILGENRDSEHKYR